MRNRRPAVSHRLTEDFAETETFCLRPRSQVNVTESHTMKKFYEEEESIYFETAGE